MSIKARNIEDLVLFHQVLDSPMVVENLVLNQIRIQIVITQMNSRSTNLYWIREVIAVVFMMTHIHKIIQ